jgi:transcriptional regulator with XRE-family HTH domain
MREQEPTVRSRELGDGLRQAMHQAGLNGKQTAYLLGWSPSWVSRLLSGKRGSTELDIAAFLGVCRVKGPERDRLLALCQEQRRLPEHPGSVGGDRAGGARIAGADCQPGNRTLRRSRGR